MLWVSFCFCYYFRLVKYIFWGAQFDFVRKMVAGCAGPIDLHTKSVLGTFFLLDKKIALQHLL